MKISGAIPVHNEEAYLPYSLESLKNADIDELVVVLDRCNDKSEEIIDFFAKKANYPIVKHKLEQRKWRGRTAEVFKVAFEHCSGDVIYSLAADCIYNPKIFSVDWTEIDFASFPYYAYDVFGSATDKIQSAWFNFLKKILNVYIPKITGDAKFSGIYAFKKQVNKIPRFDTPSEDIWFLQEAFAKGFRYKYFADMPNLHLRPSTGQRKNTQFGHGLARAKLGYSFWKVLAHSIVFGKLSTIKGFIRGKAK